MKLHYWFAGLTLALGGCGQADNPTAEAPSNSDELTVGSQAPEFELPGSDGKTHKLSNYRGEHVVLAFFPKAFTGG